MDCELCLARVQEKERIVFENDQVFVLVNHEPLKDGHVIVLPTRHVGQLGDLQPDEAQAFLQTLDKCMLAVARSFGDTPMCLVNGQEFRSQPHLHAHVLPSKQGIRGLYAAAEGVVERKRADKSVLFEIANKLKAAF